MKGITKSTQTFLIALIFILGTLILFGFIVWKGLGGEEALFLIVGHLAAWAELAAIYYLRKKPKDTTNNTDGQQ